MFVASLLLLLQVTDPPQLATDSLVHRNGRVPRAAVATPTKDPIKIDGRLDEAAWATARVETGFRRDVPSDGKPAAQETEVRVLYDRENLYVGARLHDDKPALVSRRLSRRDSFSNFNDIFFAMIDSYHDHRSQFIFGVTPAGERRDAATTGDGATFDTSWDPVWEAKTHLDSLGWTAEFRIPFSQLRFPPGSRQIWGIQFRRDIVRAGEAVDWNWSPRTEPGGVSKYGHLLGLMDIPAPKRLELLPYGLSQARLTQGADRTNPFDDGSVSSVTGGLDVKYGVTSDLTLNATVNPDFGQVEADPSVVNLTAFETFFIEQRPFFVEGSSLFDFGSQLDQTNFFYSRRIGRTPSLFAGRSAPYVDAPFQTSILAAAKLSGRTQSGWSIGVFEAVTGRETARRANGLGQRLSNVTVEPLTNYAVVRLRHENPQGSTGFGVFGSGVNRKLDDAIRDSLRSAAYTFGADFYHRFARNAYQITGVFGGSVVQGSASSIAATQRASARYYQRPDQSYIRYDPLRRSLSGVVGELRFQKVEGNWTYAFGGSATSPGLETNDAGFLTQTDRISVGAEGGRRWLSPGKAFRNASISASASQKVNFGGINVSRRLSTFGQGTFHNFTSVSLEVEREFRSLSDRETRGGPLTEQPATWGVGGGVSTDSRKLLSFGAGAQFKRDERGGSQWSIGPNLTFQSRGRLNFQISPTYAKNRSRAFYVTQRADAQATSTFGGRYVFADLDQHTISVSARLNVYFTPSLTLQLYAQPFVATGDYTEFKELAAPRTYSFRPYGSGGSTIALDPATNVYTVDPDGAGTASPFAFGNPDFRIRSIRSNLVLRWEYLPGSTLFLVWNQNRFNFASDPRFRALRDLGGIFGDDMQNVFLVKMNYYLSR